VAEPSAEHDRPDASDPVAMASSESSTTDAPSGSRDAAGGAGGAAGAAAEAASARGKRAYERVDAVLYPVFAGACVLYAALTFYGSLHRQTHGAWSAPLDDVFIHFDYARATARGFPFEWSEGNGFSSGNTSLTYPFVLAIGYLVGFRGTSLMLWAAIVACVATLGFLMAAARLADPLGRWAKYLLPPAVLCVGALDWSLFSGMENAFHLGMWGLTLVAVRRISDGAAELGRGVVSPTLAARSWLAGVTGALLFATRPESIVCVAALGALAAWDVARATRPLEGSARALGAAGATLARIAAPGALAVAIQAAANRVFTGEWAANGAIAKLTLNDPYMPPREKWDEYLFLLKYVVLRNTQHHFAEAPASFPGWGWIVPAVGLVPLFAKRTRKIAIVLWASSLGWLALVAMNRQVRWQNERYTMSAVAWVLVLFALGVGVLLSRVYPLALEARLQRHLLVERGVALAKGALAAALVLLFARAQLPQMRDQIWFFGRASRNIRDQHLVAGAKLAELHPRRVLVGDAGALMYASDAAGLDLIGLGGYHDLPFARAAVHGLGASLELLERMRPEERPDLMAIYPSWWGDLPTLFGRPVASVPVFGNVICGGAEKVLYRTDWSPFDRSSKPRIIRPGERILDELDVADLVSEKAHGYVFPHPGMGFVDFRILADVIQEDRDLFDAGRAIPPGATETARVKMPARGGRLVARTAVGKAAEIDVRIDGRAIGRLALTPAPGWTEPAIELPVGLAAEVELSLTPVGDEWLDCHLWILDRGDATAAP
jgi:hypothetical protein